MDRIPPGTVFGNEFRVVRLLREGGMGAVYVVEQLSTGRHRALKVLSRELGNDAGARERFVREARIGARIDSDHVVEVVTAGVDAAMGCPYLVMELLVGEDLDEIAEAYGPLPLGDTAEIFAQVGHALERAHALSIVHRDIKPANVFLAAPRRRGAVFTVKVLDFGIAKAVADNKLTTSQPLGTPLYMAPEQMERAAQVTPAADVWSLGLMAFRLLTGHDLWRASNESLAALVREMVVEPVPKASVRARELGAEALLPAGFDEWFARALAREPKDRFADAGEAIAAFSALVPPGTPSGRLAEWLLARSGAAVESARTVLASNPSPLSGVIGSGVLTPSIGTPGKVVTPSEPPTGDGKTRYASGPQGTMAAHAVATVAKPRQTSRAIVVGGALAAVAGAGVVFSLTRTKSPAESTAPPSAAIAVAPVASAPPPPRCPVDMALIEGGSMFMGDLDLENARPPHKVTVSRFCLDRREATAAAYDACVERGHCLKAPQDVHFTGVTDAQKAAFAELCNARRPGRGNHPANCVDFAMAENFCGTKGGRLADGGARLPTEAEWEFAARGSGQKAYPWGDEPPDATRLNACGTECAAWFVQHKLPTKTLYATDDGFFGTAPVGSFLAGASREGVLDLAGNVWEWTADWYGPYTGDTATDPKGADSGTERVVRGGSFNGYISAWAKPAYRWKTTPDVYNHAIGFRCAASPS